MKFLILLEDYNHFYTKNINLSESLSYQDKLEKLLAQKFYQSDSLANALRKLGNEVSIVIPECNPLQLSWAYENEKSLFSKWQSGRIIRSIQSRLFNNYHTFQSIREKVLKAQIEQEKPDVIYIYSGVWLSEHFLESLRKKIKHIILQWTCPIVGRWNDFSFRSFDFIVSASEPIVQHFKKLGLKSYYIQQAFDEDILKKVTKKTQTKDVVFIGNYSLAHETRLLVLEYLLANHINLDIYGSGKEHMPENSLVRKKMQPPLQGIEMYNVYRGYKIGLHIATEGLTSDGIDLSSFAGAKRNFEITGVGTALLTSYQPNLRDLFKIDEEIITFNSKEECLEKIHFYLANKDKLEKIAAAGQARVLKEHTFLNRAKQLLSIIEQN